MGGITEGERKRALKEIIKQLHAGVSLEQVKEGFKQFLEGVTPAEIAKIEQELVNEGISREQIQKLCDLHLEVFKEQLQKQKVEIAQENPLRILVEEHRMLEQIAGKLTALAESGGAAGERLPQLGHAVEELLEAEKHYLREENVLFPVLEKHGIREPPAIMWMEHNRLREEKKRLKALIEKFGEMDPADFEAQLRERARALSTTLSSHIFKENHILFPTALQAVTEEEWVEVRRDFDEIGYCSFTPPHLTAPRTERAEEGKVAAMPGEPGALQFETGILSREEVEAVLDTLPVDMTFVDATDTVKYFNKAEKRLFVRTKAVIGRKVQLCHPQKSIHVVNRILEAFRKGQRDVAEFWIQKDNRLIYIRYFAVRDKNGKYLGTLEVTQDITDMKKIEGEKRLLDWEE